MKRQLDSIFKAHNRNDDLSEFLERVPVLYKYHWKWSLIWATALGLFPRTHSDHQQIFWPTQNKSEHKRQSWMARNRNLNVWKTHPSNLISNKNTAGQSISICPVDGCEADTTTKGSIKRLLKNQNEEIAVYWMKTRILWIPKTKAK